MAFQMDILAFAENEREFSGEMYRHQRNQSRHQRRHGVSWRHVKAGSAGSMARSASAKIMATRYLALLCSRCHFFDAEVRDARHRIKHACRRRRFHFSPS